MSISTVDIHPDVWPMSVHDPRSQDQTEGEETMAWFDTIIQSIKGIIPDHLHLSRGDTGSNNPITDNSVRVSDGATITDSAVGAGSSNYVNKSVTHYDPNVLNGHPGSPIKVDVFISINSNGILRTPAGRVVKIKSRAFTCEGENCLDQAFSVIDQMGLDRYDCEVIMYNKLVPRS